MSENHSSKEPGFIPTFENGGFWELYKDLEHQFEDFLTYVPYLEGNQETYSFRLLNLILSIGGHIDSAFKEMARFPQFSENDDCKQILKRASDKKGIFDSAVKAFEGTYSISTRKVIFKRLPEREPTTPFCPASEWWTFYNNLKHEVSFNLRYANLMNARDALAGAFLLNVRHIPGALRLYDYSLVSFSSALFGRELFEELLNHEKRFKVPCFVEIQLFRYNYVE